MRARFDVKRVRVVVALAMSATACSSGGVSVTSSAGSSTSERSADPPADTRFAPTSSKQGARGVLRVTRSSLLEPADAPETLAASSSNRSVLIDRQNVDCAGLGFAADDCLDDPDADFAIPVWLAAGRPACRGVGLPAPVVTALARLDLRGGGSLDHTVLEFANASDASGWMPGDLEEAAGFLADVNTRCSIADTDTPARTSPGRPPDSFTTCDLGDECVELGPWTDRSGTTLIRVDNVVIGLSTTLVIGMRVECDDGECGPAGGQSGAVSGIPVAVAAAALDKVVAG